MVDSAMDESKKNSALKWDKHGAPNRQKENGFFADCSIFVEASGNDKIDGPFELLSFIQIYHIGDSKDPNIVILLRIFLTQAISVASRERSFSKLKLIKNYLRSAMSQTRLTDLAFLSIERELSR